MSQEDLKQVLEKDRINVNTCSEKLEENYSEANERKFYLFVKRYYETLIQIDDTKNNRILLERAQANYRRAKENYERFS